MELAMTELTRLLLACLGVLLVLWGLVAVADAVRHCKHQRRNQIHIDRAPDPRCTRNGTEAVPNLD